MSEENVELARAAYEAFSRGDRTAWLALHDADFEVVPILDWPEPGVRPRGCVGLLRRLVRRVRAAPVEPGDLELVDAGDDKVLVHHQFDVRGRASGVDVGAEYWIVVAVAQGRFVRAQFFADRAEALEAAGLRE